MVLWDLWRREFSGYSVARWRQDVFAGITVAAVALPLALAFGVASGATAAAGLVTAILGGLIIGGLSGAPYQISGPTGAMSAVLLVLAQTHGLPGVWAAGVMAGAIMLVIGALKWGRFLAFIPASVVTGFTSGIALIIAISQIDSLLGVDTPMAESAALKVLGYLRLAATLQPDGHALALGGLVIAIMVLWPARWGTRFPASLFAIAVATIVPFMAGWQVAEIAEIPHGVLLADRLDFGAFPFEHLRDLLLPALSIAALGAVESLLCGSVASNMTGVRLHADQELVAQGVGNILIPFFGGVPATAAIARTSVGIKSGGQTRMVSLVHAVVLLASMFVLAPVMSHIPLAALAGVLLVTAWRMNEWHAIRFLLRHRIRSEILAFLVTLGATVVLDLTWAILLGAGLSAAVFLNKIARLQATVQPLDPEKLRRRGIELHRPCEHIQVAYLIGPVFFAAIDHFHSALAKVPPSDSLVLSMRGVPLIDLSGVEALTDLANRVRAAGGTLLIVGVQERVRQMLERGGVVALLGEENFFWGADHAILALDARGCGRCTPEQ